MSKITAELDTKDGKKVYITIEEPSASPDGSCEAPPEATVTETDDSISFSTPSGKILTITIAE